MALTVAGSMSACVLPESRPQPRVSIDPGGVLHVPLARSVSNIESVATVRESVPLEPEVSGAHVYVIRPGDTSWSLIEATGAHGGPILDTRREGLYRLLVCDVQTHGLLPTVSDTEGLRLQVDRRPPVLDLRAKREGERWIVEYRIEDDLALLEPASLMVSDDGGQRWRKVYQALGRHGELSWRFPAENADRFQFNFTATDLAGNGATLQRRLLDLDRIVVTGDVASNDRDGTDAGPTTLRDPGPRGSVRTETADLDPSRVDNASGHGESDVTPAASGTGTSEATPAVGRVPSPDPRVVWRDIHDRNLALAGDSVIVLAGGFERVFLESPDGQRKPLERVGEDSVRIPTVDGVGYHLVATIRGQELRSVAVRIDSQPPELTLIAAEERQGGLFLRYRVRDDEIETVRVRLQVARNQGEWQPVTVPTPLVSDQVVEHWVSLAPGEYEFHLEARDIGGRRVEAPSRDTPLVARIVAGGPRVATVQGQRYRGGNRHTLYFDRADPELVRGMIQVLAVPVAESADSEPRPPLAICDIDVRTSTRSWRVPATSGEYRFSLRWNDRDGRQCEWTSHTTFFIDSGVPEFVWDEIDVDRYRASARITSSEESVEAWEFYRRPGRAAEAGAGAEPPLDPLAGWTAVVPASIETIAPAWVAVVIQTDDWAEGRWQLGASARDPVGNRPSAPTPSPVFDVDRSPPRLDDFVIPPVMVEGVTSTMSVAGGDAESRSPGMDLRARWEPVGRSAIELILPALTSIEGEPRYAIALPPGRGRLTLIATDSSGNQASKSEEVVVHPAVEELEFYPRIVAWTGLMARIEYRLAAPHPRADRPLEARIVRYADGVVERRLPIDKRAGELRFRVPSTAGLYELVIAPIGEERGFLRGHKFTVKEHNSSTSGGEGGADHRSDLLLRFRDFHIRWDKGERWEGMDRERSVLREQLRAVIEESPMRLAHRRALAGLYVDCDPKELAEARRILRGGFGATDEQSLPMLYDDLAAIEVMDGDYGEAALQIGAALQTSETAQRRANLGRVFLNAGQPARGVREYQRAMQLDPDSPAIRAEWLYALSRFESPEREAALHSALGRIGRWEQERRIDRDESLRLERLVNDYLEARSVRDR